MSSEHQINGEHHINGTTSIVGSGTANRRAGGFADLDVVEPRRFEIPTRERSPANQIPPSPKRDHDPSPVEHVLAVVEPTAQGDAVLGHAQNVVARGGRASILMLITDRVNDDIRSYAASEDLSFSEAEASAFERLTSYCIERVGADVPTIVERFGRFGSDIGRHVTDDVTAVVVPEGTFRRRGLDKLAERAGRPVVVARAAA